MALVIRRYPRQGIRIGKDIWIYAKERDRGNQITFAIVAPEGVNVIREELLIAEGGHPGPLFDAVAYVERNKKAPGHNDPGL